MGIIEKKPKEIFNDRELKIISEYFGGASVRQLAETHEGFGRTKIKNLIDRYMKEFPKTREEIENKRLKDKYHKKDDEKVELEDLTEEQIAEAYNKIRYNDETLTQMAKSYGRTRDYLKKRILEYIDDPEEEQEFLSILKLNPGTAKKEEFLELPEDAKKRVLFEKLNKRRQLNGRREYTDSFLERKYTKLKRYLLDVRNRNIEEKSKLSEEDFYKILFDTPTLLSSSLSDRIVPALENLDYHPDVGTQIATKIIKEDGSILCSSIQRTNLQIRILKDNNLLDACFEKPRTFRTSPEMMYALIEFHKEGRKGKPIDPKNVFLTKSKLFEKYGLTSNKLMRDFKVKDAYGDDEYFEK